MRILHYAALFLVNACLLSMQLVSGRGVDIDEYKKGVDLRSTISANIEARDRRNAVLQIRSNQRFEIHNVRVFDGRSLSELSTVIVDGDKIGETTFRCTDCERIDGHGSTLLPGLIDSHYHPVNVTHLETLTRYGVTTALSMACYNPAACESLQHHSGQVDIKTSTAPAAAPGSAHGNITVEATNSTALLLSNPEQVPHWIVNQTSWNPDFIKSIAESPGLDQTTLNALASHARDNGRLSVCHAADYSSYSQAVAAGFNHVHHTPLDKAVDRSLLESMVNQKQVSTPTLTIMRAIGNMTDPKAFSVANASAGALNAAKVPILAGTDANEIPGFIANVPFGSSLHLELELLVAAGLHPVEALRAATIDPARHFQLHDRGVIAPGKRADLLLIDGDPTKDISATRNIKRVWVAGVECGAL